MHVLYMTHIRLHLRGGSRRFPLLDKLSPPLNFKQMFTLKSQIRISTAALILNEMHVYMGYSVHGLQCVCMYISNL